MPCVYVLRQNTDDLFKVGRTNGPIDQTIRQLARGNPYPLSVFTTIDTEEAIACETHLHRALRSKRVVLGGGSEFFQVSESELMRALDEARGFVEDFLAIKRKASDLSAAEVDESLPLVLPEQEDYEVYSALLRVREAEDRICSEREYFESKLKLRIGTAAGLKGIATWKGAWARRMDTGAFKKSEPDLYEDLLRRFMNESYSRRFCIQKAK